MKMAKTKTKTTPQSEAAQPPPPPAPAAEPEAQPEPEQAAPSDPDEGFVDINPPLPVYMPTSKEDRLRGYPLSRQVLPGDVTYYIVQLTRTLDAAQNGDGARSMKPGELVLVAENLSISMLARMLPAWGGGANGSPSVHATTGYEVILAPFRREYGGSASPWFFVHRARRLEGTEVAAIKPPPSFALPDLPQPN
jgi:hypothetical protein